jgi:hypothetical protein
MPACIKANTTTGQRCFDRELEASAEECPDKELKASGNWIRRGQTLTSVEGCPDRELEASAGELNGVGVLLAVRDRVIRDREG